MAAPAVPGGSRRGTGRVGAVGEPQRTPGGGRSGAGLGRTALCVEPRDGGPYIFFAPGGGPGGHFDLVAAVEEPAAEVRMPVLIEGYPPPSDHRMNCLKVTPDPGVIEVNIHPAHSWDELVELTNGLYEDAHRTRLATEKFMVDGRHAGTGG